MANVFLCDNDIPGCLARELSTRSLPIKRLGEQRFFFGQTKKVFDDAFNVSWEAFRHLS
jgi:hypothetical protein